MSLIYQYASKSPRASPWCALIIIASSLCVLSPARSAETQRLDLEKDDLKLGFIKLVDKAPLSMDLNDNGITVSNDGWEAMKPHLELDTTVKPVHPISASALKPAVESYNDEDRAFNAVTQGIGVPIITDYQIWKNNPKEVFGLIREFVEEALAS